MDKDSCIALIQHQTTGDLDQMLSCAQMGYSGNAAWPRPSISTTTAAPPTPSGLLPLPNPIVRPPNNNIVMSDIVPPVPEIVPPPPVAECHDFNDWIKHNPMLAIGIVILVWAVKS